MNNVETLRPAIRHAGHTMTEAEALAKMNAYIETCKTKAVATLSSIQHVVPTDRVIPATEQGLIAHNQRVGQIAGNINQLKGELGASEFYRRMFVWGFQEPNGSA